MPFPRLLVRKWTLQSDWSSNWQWRGTHTPLVPEREPHTWCCLMSELGTPIFFKANSPLQHIQGPADRYIWFRRNFWGSTYLWTLLYLQILVWYPFMDNNAFNNIWGNHVIEEYAQIEKEKKISNFSPKEALVVDGCVGGRVAYRGSDSAGNPGKKSN